MHLKYFIAALIVASSSLSFGQDLSDEIMEESSNTKEAAEIETTSEPVSSGTEDLTPVVNNVKSLPAEEPTEQSATPVKEEIESDLSKPLVPEKKVRSAKAGKEVELELDDTDQDGKKLSLRDILEEGLRNNAAENIRSHLREKYGLNWKDNYQKFWLPEVNLSFQNNPHRLTTLYHGTSSGLNLNGTSRTADGAVGIEMGELTLFNWGRDYLEYQNSQKTIDRQKQVLQEQRRGLKFGLITRYFDLVRLKLIQKGRKDLLRQTSFVHRLAKQKLSLRKINSDEYLQAKAEFLLAQSNYQDALFNTALAEEQMANLLNDLPQTRYVPVNEMAFVEVRTEIDEATELALKQSPKYRNARLALDNTQRTYEKTIKDNMPLPKLTLNLGAYQFQQSAAGTNTQYLSGQNSSNIEVVATLNFKWNILGQGGLFNYRNKERGYLDKRMAEIDYFNTKRELELKIKIIYRTIKYQETQIKISQTRLNNATQVLDTILDNYIAGKTGFPNLKIALDNLINSEIYYQNIKFDHLVNKLQLADLMGMEDFPGENFENLAQK